MSGPRLSIVIPTYNTAPMTLECCRAAVAGAPPATEVIVVDDASTDDTCERLSALPEVRIVRLETNQRFAAAANAGVEVSLGELVLLLNSDALVQRDALCAFVRAFEEDRRLGVAGARLLNRDGTPQWSGGPEPTLAWLFVLAWRLAPLLPRRQRVMGGAPVAWVSGAAMMFRRAVWNAAGPLSTRYRFYAQDLEFCLRARSLGWDVRVIEGAPVVHEGGGTLARDPCILREDLLAWARVHRGAWWATAARLLMSAPHRRSAAREPAPPANSA